MGTAPISSHAERNHEINANAWEKTKKGSLIHYRLKGEEDTTHAICKTRKGDKMTLVILTEQNRKNIANGKPVETTELLFDACTFFHTVIA